MISVRDASRRLLLVVALAICNDVRAECESIPGESVETLESQLAQTERQLDQTPESQRHKSEYRALQERALGQLEALQCKAESQAPAETVKRGFNVATAFASVPILFITDRKQVDSPADSFFGGDRKVNGVTYGRVIVRMPAENYTPGKPLPPGITVDTEKNSKQGITVRRPAELGETDFQASLSEFKKALQPGDKLRVLLFIHGYNVTYADSMKAAARLTWGLRPLTVAPIAVSWPSQGMTLRYWQDEQTVEPSIERLRPILGGIFANPNVDEVILVAHSMGTRIATRVLSQLELQKASLPKLTRVAFAAADLHDAEIQELWGRIGSLPASGWNFYTSRNDFALRASQIVHARPPVGDSRQRVFTLPPAETIDASTVAPALQGYGHSYVIDNPLLQLDLRRWILEGAPAKNRGLQPGQRPPAVFWVIPELASEK